MYTLGGEFLQAFGRPGIGKAGLTGSLRICGVDTAGSVLIADRDNNRFLVMSKQGEFCTLELQPEVIRPLSAVVFSGHLYVTSGKNIHYYAI